MANSIIEQQWDDYDFGLVPRQMIISRDGFTFKSPNTLYLGNILIHQGNVVPYDSLYRSYKGEPIPYYEVAELKMLKEFHIDCASSILSGTFKHT